MIKSPKHIEIVRSTIPELSSMGQYSSDLIYPVLAKHFDQVGESIVNNLADLEALITMRPDLVFLGMEFIPQNQKLGLSDPNRIWISDILDRHEIAYTGSSQLAHELGRNKQSAKQQAMDTNLKTSPFFLIKQGQSLDQLEVSLKYPLFVKPANRGGGLGIDSDSVVNTLDQLRAKANSIITELQSDVLVEEYLPGREFSVAILKREHSDLFEVMPIELIAPQDQNGSRLLSGQIKSLNAEQAISVSDPVLKAKVSELALAVFGALNARDYGRIDIRLDSRGEPNFLEANLIPSLISGYGSFPKACEINAGLEYEPMIIQIAKLGLVRELHTLQSTRLPLSLRGPNLPSSEVELKPV